MQAPGAPVVNDPLPTYASATRSDGEDSKPPPPPAYHEIVAEDDAAAAAAAIAARAASSGDGYASSTSSAAAAAETEAEVERGEEGKVSSTEGGAVRVAKSPSAAGSVVTVASALEDGLNEEASEQRLGEGLPQASAAGVTVVAEILAGDTSEENDGDVAGPIQDAAAAAAATARTGPTIPGVAGEVPQAGGARQLRQSTAPAAFASLMVPKVDAPADSTAAPAREPAAALPASTSAAEPGASLRGVDAAGPGKAPQLPGDSSPEAAEEPVRVEGSLARHGVGEAAQPGTLVAEGETAVEKGSDTAAVKWVWLMPDGETNNAASVVFFALFFAFIFCLRSLNA